MTPDNVMIEPSGTSEHFLRFHADAHLPHGCVLETLVVVCCGHVWFGVDMCGLVWSCVVWCGHVWFGVDMCGLVWSCVVCCGHVGFVVVMCGLVWSCGVWCGYWVLFVVVWLLSDYSFNKI